MRYLVILLVVITPVLFTSCDEALLSELDTVAAENEEQAVADSLLNARLDSLLTIILDQQEYIDSLNNAQTIVDSLQQVYTDSLNSVQIQLNSDQQAYIDSLINAGNVSDSLLQVYTDSLNTVQNTLNATQQAYIDSLINAGNVSDSLLQVYTDSLNTVQNAYIDSLHNAQQTTLTALANSALSAGFTPIEVFNGDAIADTDVTITNTELDLTSTLGNNGAIGIFKIIKSHTGYLPSLTDINPGTTVPYWYGGFQDISQPQYFLLLTTDGIIYLNTICQNGAGCGGYTITVSLAFYLSQ